jgi:hypothetical protein
LISKLLLYVNESIESGFSKTEEGQAYIEYEEPITEITPTEANSLAGGYNGVCVNISCAVEAEAYE